MSATAEDVDAERAAEQQFNEFDFENSSAYTEYRNSATVVVMAGSEAATETRLRRRFFKRNVNSKLRTVHAAAAAASKASGGLAQDASRPTAPPPTRQPGGSGPAPRPTARTEPPRGGYAGWNRARVFESVAARITGSPEAMFALNAVVLVAALWTLLPFGMTQVSYRKAHVASCVIFVLNIAKESGFPRLQERDYWKRLVRLQETQYLFLSVLMRLAWAPIFASLIPLAVFALYAGLDCGVKLLRKYVRSEQHQLFMPIASTAVRFKPQALRAVSFIEPWIVLEIVLRIILGRSILGGRLMTLVGHVQFCRWRYRLSRESRDLWKAIDEYLYGRVEQDARLSHFYRGVRDALGQSGTVVDLADGQGGRQ